MIASRASISLPDSLSLDTCVIQHHGVIAQNKVLVNSGDFIQLKTSDHQVHVSEHCLYTLTFNIDSIEIIWSSAIMHPCS